MEIITISHNGSIVKAVAVKQGQGEDILYRLVEADRNNELVMQVLQASQKLPDLIDSIISRDFDIVIEESPEKSTRGERIEKMKKRSDRSDRTVHGFTQDGGQVVRYNTAGKWWVEYPNGLRERQHVTISQAVDATHTFLTGKAGGLRFDAIARQRYGAKGQVSQ